MEGSGTSWLTTAMSSLWDVVTTCITNMTSNAYLSMFLAGSVIILGFKIFRSAKKTSRK